MSNSILFLNLFIQYYSGITGTIFNLPASDMFMFMNDVVIVQVLFAVDCYAEIYSPVMVCLLANFADNRVATSLFL